MTSPNATELRIACVMNGGVSLAVWMAGVAHEMDLLRRASLGGAAVDAGVPGYDHELWRRWQEAAGGRRVLVDIVAGTSAGGINGALLAAAVAAGGRLDWPDEERTTPLLRQLWEEEAGLDKLVPPPEQEPPRSLLDGAHLDNVIGSTLQAVAEEGRRRARPDGAGDHPVTLFVTATALGESDEDYRDGFDQTFRVQDHRRRYRFRYDPAHVEFSATARQFERHPLREFDEHAPALRRAARASSSFPVAFEPVAETTEMLGPPVRVQPAAPSEAPAWLADGGILDNSPFGPVLQEIAHRAPDAEVERLLVYVVPSRGTRPGDVEGASPRVPAPDWPAVAGSALRFPSESDFRDDIAEIRELLFAANTQQQTVRMFCEHAHGPVAHEAGPALVATAAELLPTYWRGSLAGRIREARTLAEHSGTRPAPRSLQSPADVLTIDRELQQLPEAERGAPQPPFGGSEPVLDRPWAWGLGAGERCARMFARDVMDHFADGAQLTTQAAGLAEVLRRITALDEVLDDRLAAHSPEELRETRDARRVVEGTAAALGVPEVMRELMRRAAEHYASAVTVLGVSATAEDVTRVALAVEISDRAMRAGMPYQRVPRFTFLRLGPDVDAPVLTDVAGDGASGSHLGDLKLYGTRIGHFAAFGKAEWRRHDWLWGRLDAVAHLGRALLCHHRDDRAIRDWIRETQALVLANEVEAPSAEQLWRTTDQLLGTKNEDLLKDLGKEGDVDWVDEIQTRAARMIADQFDISFIPEAVERMAVKRLLGTLVDRLGGDGGT